MTVTPTAPPRERPRTPGSRTARLRPLLALVVLVLACWGTVVATFPATAPDPALVSASPAPGEDARALTEVRVTFDRPVAAAVATLRLTNPLDVEVVTGRPYNPPGAPDTIAAPMPDARIGGTYAVAWSLPTAAGGLLEGRYTFQVFQASTEPAPPALPRRHDIAVTIVHGTAQVLSLLAFVVATGVAFALALTGAAPTGRPLARRLLLGSWWVLFGGTAVALLTLGGYVARTSFLTALDPAVIAGGAGSARGTALQARLFALVPAAIGLTLLLRSGPAGSRTERLVRGLTALGAAAAVAASWAYAGPHPAGGPSFAMSAGSVLVLLTAAVAVGGSVALWAALRSPAKGRKATGLPWPAPAVARILPPAAVLLAAAAVLVGGPGQAIALGVAAVAAVAASWTTARAARRALAPVEEPADEELTVREKAARKREAAEQRPAVRGVLVATAVGLVALAVAGLLPGDPGLLGFLPFDPLALALPLHLF